MKIIKKLTEKYLTGTCVLCGTESDRLDLCLNCKRGLPWIQKFCRGCGLPLLKGSSAEFCGACLNRKTIKINVIPLFYYQEPVTKMILALKFGNKLIYARILGEIFGRKLRIYYNNRKKPEMMIPVPLHSKRLQERGYNQALEIARPIAKQLKIPLDWRLCRRIKNTKPQTLIPATDRYDNLKKAFVVGGLKAKHIAIVDDVITTGSTVAELSRALFQKGVTSIDIWCCARAVFT